MTDVFLLFEFDNLDAVKQVRVFSSAKRMKAFIELTDDSRSFEWNRATIDPEETK